MGSLEFVRKLVAHGADVNARVTIAAAAGRRIGAELHRRDAVPARRADRGRRADAPAPRARRRPAIAHRHRTRRRSWWRPASAAALPGEEPGTEAEVLEALELLLDAGRRHQRRRRRGNTAMHGAAYKHLP